MALQALVAGDPSLIWLSIEHVMEEGKKAISHHVVIETTYQATLAGWMWRVMRGQIIWSL